MRSLAVERLAVRRMPGIRDGGFELERLSPGLNVIHGPNASGKTTTSHAIEALLWPQAAAPRASWLSAHLSLGGEAWAIELDSGRASYQRDGTDSDAFVLPSPEGRDRYRLSLHELLAAEDAGFAQAIARESAGGFDPVAAAKALGARPAASKSAKEAAALKEARARLDAARRAQEALFSDEKRLRDMEQELAGRAALEARIRLLERAIGHAGMRVARDDAAHFVHAFDPRMEWLHGDEAERLQQIADKLQARITEAERAHEARRIARDELALLGLPEGGLPGDLLPALRVELEALREQERVIAAKEQELAAARTRCEHELRAIGGAVNEARLRALDSRGIEELATFARRRELLAAERAALEAQLAELAPGDEPRAERSTLEHGIRLLQSWLRSAPATGERESRLRTLGALAAAALVVAGLALGLVMPVLAAAALVGVVLLVLILRGGASDARSAYQSDFAKLALGAPAAWSADAVEAHLERLQQALAAAWLEEGRAQRRTEAERRLGTLIAQFEPLDAHRTEVATRLGVDPQTADGSLVWLVERIGRWHEANATADGAAAALEAARTQFSHAAARACERAAPFALAAEPNVASLAGALAALDAKHSDHADAMHGIAQANPVLDRARTEITGLGSDQRAIFERLGLMDADVGTATRCVEEWCARHAEFQAARNRLQVAGAQRAEAEARLAEMPHFEESLLLEREDALAARLAEAQDQLATLAALHDEATQIRTRIELASSAHAVEDALSEFERAEQALREARERDTRAVLMQALANFVQRSTRDQHLPRVFHRARELFIRITHGRYRLDFVEGEAAAFRAFDTTTGIGHPLDELSSASRVQLLLAVRLAFVETQESGTRLPLLLDETLGNSDDARAGAIMEAVLALAAEGRQIFYFTAQPDEVGKWQGLLAQHPEVPSRVIDLAEARRLARGLKGLQVVRPPERVIPLPDGMSHAAYGPALGVPALELFGPVDAAHLWYLVEEPDALHDLLARLRVERWGELRALVEHGGRVLLDAGLLARIEARARALDVALELRRVGRGRPVDRAAIRECPAISETFLDALDELCREHAGDARQVIEALERGEVKRFRTQAREALREHLERNGYLDARDVLASAELRARAVASVHGEIARGVISVGEVERILAYC